MTGADRGLGVLDRTRSAAHAALLLACMLTCRQSSALLAQTAPPSRTANGASTEDALVLSTGASRGFAHAGVLVGLDSLGYDPDIVVGTSMGAVLGALYAAGYTPAEIWRLVESVDWGDTFKPAPQVHLLFDANAATRGDFDRLPRRYRAVVADLSTGEEMVLDRGDLARAVRMSMGAPGFFAPLELDGRLLADDDVTQVPGDVLVVRVDGAPRLSLDVAPGYDNDRGGRMWAGVQQRLATPTPTELSFAASMDGLERWGELSVRVQSARRPLSLALGLYSRQFDARHIGVDTVGAEQQVWRSGVWLAAERREVFPDWLATLGLHGEYVDVQDGEHGASFGPLLRVTSSVPPGLAVGGPVAVQAELRAGDVSYVGVRLDASRRFPLPGLVAAAVAEFDWTNGGAPPDARPALGDGHSMPGLAWGAERGDARVVGGIDVARPFLMSGILRTRLRAGSARTRGTICASGERGWRVRLWRAPGASRSGRS